MYTGTLCVMFPSARWVWVPAMTVSFGFLPTSLRVPYYLVMSFGYAILVGRWQVDPFKPTLEAPGTKRLTL